MSATERTAAESAAAPAPSPPVPGAAAAVALPGIGFTESLAMMGVDQRAGTVHALQRTAGNQRVTRMLASMPRPRPSGTRRLQRFEAPVHESGTRVSDEKAGLSPDEATADYYGNWMRDLNQLFVPAAKKALGLDNETLFAVLSSVAMKKFGVGVAGKMTPDQFGFYIPAEHLDSPAGLVAKDDLLPTAPVIAPHKNDPKAPEARLNVQDDVRPDATVSGDIKANIFSVDQTGMIAYLRRSQLRLEERLKLAVKCGRSADGFRHLGAAKHAVQDLFAHSNWVEIAVSELLASDPALLPGLKGEDRQVFDYAGQVTLPGVAGPNGPVEGPPERRAVLTTGSFTAADTMMSLGSEFATMLRTEPTKARSDPERRAQQEVNQRLLDKFGDETKDKELRAKLVDQLVKAQSEKPPPAEGQPRVEPGLRETVKDGADRLIRGAGRAVADRTLQSAGGIAWLHQAVFSLPLLPKVFTQLTYDVEVHVWKNYLVPLADQLESIGQEGNVADTALSEQRKEYKALQAGELGTFSRMSLDLQETAGAMTKAQKTKKIGEMKTDAASRLKELDKTPEQVVAGPSHSQIGKDHANSPFFGLAYALKERADEEITKAVADAWTGQPAYERPSEGTKAAEVALAAIHAKEEAESLEAGKRVLRDGGVASKVNLDLHSIGEDAASKLHETAAAMQALARSPGQAKVLLNKLKGYLDPGRVKRTVERGRDLAGEAEQSAVMKDLAAVGQRLDVLAEEVRRARTHDEREIVNLKLRDLRNEAITALPKGDAESTGIILTALETEIGATSVSYTKDQRAELERTRDLKVETIEMPDLAKLSTEERAVLEVARRFFAHPMEGPRWWEPLVRSFILAHPDQIMADIEARNAGYAVLPAAAKGPAPTP